MCQGSCGRRQHGRRRGTLLSTLVEDDEYAAVHHKVDIRAENIDDLNATISLGVLGNIDEESVLSKHRVEGCYCVLICLCNLTVILFHELWMFLCGMAERINDDAIAGLHFRQSLCIELVVDNEVEMY